MSYLTLFPILFIISFIISFVIYSKHYDKLAVFHKASLIVDILVWIGATILIITSLIYYNTLEKYNFLLFLQFIFASCSYNIHISRFFIGLLSKNR